MSMDDWKLAAHTLLCMLDYSLCPVDLLLEMCFLHSGCTKEHIPVSCHSGSPCSCRCNNTLFCVHADLSTPESLTVGRYENVCKQKWN